MSESSTSGELAATPARAGRPALARRASAEQPRAGRAAPGQPRDGVACDRAAGRRRRRGHPPGQRNVCRDAQRVQAPKPPTPPGRPIALSDRAVDTRSITDALGPPPPRHDHAGRRLPAPIAATHPSVERRARARGTTTRRVGPRTDQRPGGAAGRVRRRRRRRRDTRRRARHRGRSERAVDGVSGHRRDQAVRSWSSRPPIRGDRRSPRRRASARRRCRWTPTACGPTCWPRRSR